MIEGSRISKLGDTRSRSRSWTTSALPEKISFTARWNVVMLSASYVKFRTRTSVMRASSNQEAYDTSEARSCSSLPDEGHSQVREHARHRGTLLGPQS